jgi:hypothetical protein
MAGLVIFDQKSVRVLTPTPRAKGLTANGTGTRTFIYLLPSRMRSTQNKSHARRVFYNLPYARSYPYLRVYYTAPLPEEGFLGLPARLRRLDFWASQLGFDASKDASPPRLLNLNNGSLLY